MRFGCSQCYRDFDIRPEKCPACGCSKMHDRYQGLDGRVIVQALDRCCRELQTAYQVALACRAHYRPELISSIQGAQRQITRVVKAVGSVHPELAGALERKVLEAKASNTSRTLT